MTNGHQHIPENILNIDILLEAIQGENPCGDSLRYEGTYDKIEDARRQDDPSLPQGVWEKELKKADWSRVSDLCQDTLKYRSKDLHIAIRFMESLIHIYEFEGIRDGLQLIAGLCEQYWNCLYPEISEDDTDMRLAPIVWMNNTLYLKLKLIPITKPVSTDIASYTYADKEKADILEELAKKEKKIPEGSITRILFNKSEASTSINFYENTARYLKDSLLYIEQLDRLLEEKCGKDDCPSLNQFKTTLEIIQRFVDSVIKKRPTNHLPIQGDTESDGKKTEKIEDYIAGNFSIKSREEAYQILREVADYLEIREPHSPVPFLVKRAIKWGDMSLTELFDDLIHNKDDLKEIFKLLGLKNVNS